jgi:O-methyltransferase
LQSSPIRQISVLRLDGDYYSSTIDILEALFDRVSSGGYLIVDDYGNWQGCRQAVHEFCDKRGIIPDITHIDRCGVYWRKG